MKYLVGFLRIFVGIFFIISGFIKLNDPIGFAFKLEEYFGVTVLDLPFLMPYALGISIIVVVLEVLLGVFLIIGYKPKFTVWSLLLMIVFFTFLTFYSAYYDKVKDCGCFGDAMKMDPWESFGKDVVLLVMILIIFFGIKYIKPFFGKLTTTIISLLSFIACLGFAYHVLMHLPSIDFRPYKVGDNITANMIIPEDAPQPVTEYTWTFNENGNNVEYVTNGSYPESTGKYVGVETDIIDEGYEAPIHDFSIEKDGEDFTEDILNRNHVLLVVNYNLAKAETEGLKAIKVATDKAIANGYDVIGLTASGLDELTQYKADFNLNYDYYFCDETALKTIIRSNPGVLKLEKGTIIQKLHWNDIEELELPPLENAIPNMDIDLKRQLDSIMVMDQKYRTDGDSYRENWKLQEKIDSTNLVIIEKIIKEKGYPGKSLVGEPANEAAWYVIQHSTKISEYLKLMKEAGKKGELPFAKVAMMEDRYLMDQGKKQVYGTQGTTLNYSSENSIDIIWPIEDVENVNKRRKEAGYDSTIEENGKRMYGDDFIFKNYSLKEIKEIEKENFWLIDLLKDVK